MKIRNPLFVRIFVFLLVIAAIAVVGYIAINVLLSSNALNYNLGSITDYSDEVLLSYDDYLEFVKKYDIKQDLSENDFLNSSYVASFQDYDKCSESKVKMVDNVDITGNAINITYKISNKCGWCKGNIIVYLIKTEKLSSKQYNFNYEYIYTKTINCGTIA